MKFIKYIKKIFSFARAKYLNFKHILKIIFYNLKIEFDFNFKKSSIKVAHIYASEGFKNSGDYLLGIATKWYFSKKLLKEKKIIFHNFDCRNSKIFNNKNIYKLNRYDYLLIGGGGLILPDAASNKISGWQWNISIENLKKIRVPIYVMSIGYNLFFGQSIEMQDNKSNIKTKYILNTFKKHITTLIKKSSYFSLRHRGDVKELLNVIGPEYKNKIIFQPCPTIEYIQNKWKSNNKKDKRIFTAIEVKDDREWRRYYKITKDKYYSKLLKWVQIKIKNGNELCFLSHDGSMNFYNYLIEHGIKIKLFRCDTSNEKDIFEKYSKIHTILCHAGHSQMFSFALGIRVISMVTHPKLLYFCEDFDLLEDSVNVNEDIDKIFNIEI